VAKKSTKTQFKAGFREVGGQRCYFRSRWEANYARFLQTQIAAKEIIAWKHEPETFWFDGEHGIRRGVVSYKPDFKIYRSDGSHEWHEVKGFMDHRSQMCIKRMRKFYAHEPLRIIGRDEYAALEAGPALRISEWEWPDSRPEGPPIAARIGKRLPQPQTAPEQPASPAARRKRTVAR